MCGKHAALRGDHGLKENSVGLPVIRARKFNSILNAIETQIEDYEYANEVVKALMEHC